MDKKTWQWQHTIDSQRTFLISTAKELLSHAFVQESYATEAMYWAKPLSDESTRAMLDNSCTLGVYRVINDEKTPIGLARMITDYVTFAYLTDVYIHEDYQGLGLGKWMIRCCREITMEMQNLRFLVLLTNSEQARNLYRKELGMSLLDGQEQALACMGARHTKLAEAAADEATATGERCR
ncbi:acetyltransferase [Phaeosphaeriaceae sp. PMI808]|nr:acetyltransferase [Phaeosphaeriaceae sp. PMI808]